MLSLESFAQHVFVKARRDQILITRTLGCQNRAADIDERKQQRRLEAFVFRLHVIDDALVFYVSVEAGDHNLESLEVLIFCGRSSGKIPESGSKLTQPFLQGQSRNCFADQRSGRLLDTPDHFDYDSACTMILNLQTCELHVMSSSDVRLPLVANVRRATIRH